MYLKRDENPSEKAFLELKKKKNNKGTACPKFPK